MRRRRGPAWAGARLPLPPAVCRIFLNLSRFASTSSGQDSTRAEAFGITQAIGQLALPSADAFPDEGQTLLGPGLVALALRDVEHIAADSNRKSADARSQSAGADRWRGVGL